MATRALAKQGGWHGILCVVSQDKPQLSPGASKMPLLGKPYASSARQQKHVASNWSLFVIHHSQGFWDVQYLEASSLEKKI